MAGISHQKMKEIEAEMDRFEEEISGAPPPPPPPPPGTAGKASTSSTLKNASDKTTDSDSKDRPSFSALPPPPPPPVINVAPGLKPPPPPPPRGFMPPQLRHRHAMPPRPPPMGMPPRPPPMNPPRGMPPRGPPPRAPPHFIGPPRLPTMGPMPPGAPMGPPGHPPMGPPHMGPHGPNQGGPPRGPPPPGYYGSAQPAPHHPQPETQAPPVQAEEKIENQPSATIEKAKVVYAAPVKAADVVKQQLEAKKRKVETKEKQPEVAPGIEMNVPAHEIEVEKSNQEHVGRVIPDIDVDAIVRKYQQDKAKKEKKKKFVRTAAGQTWEDPTLEEWDTDDFRIFCGDLGNEVTDEVLARAFSRYPTFQKAKVVRDKRTNKTKGFGFVSFKDPNDFVRAMREMNGKYVGNRPIKLRKSNWKDRQVDVVKKKDKEKKKLGLR